MNQQKALTTGACFWLGVKDSLSVALAGGMFALVFGALSQAKGFSLFLTNAMSASMYAGAAQMMVLNLWHPQALHFFSLALVVLIICLRYFLMSFSLRPHWSDLPAWKVYLALFFLMDESWAMTMLKAKQKQFGSLFLLSYFVGIGVLSYFFWLLGTLLGVFLASKVTNLASLGVGFAFTALFLCLMLGAWRDKRDILSWGLALLVAIAAKLCLPGNWYILVGALVGSLAGAVYEYTA